MRITETFKIHNYSVISHRATRPVARFKILKCGHRVACNVCSEVASVLPVYCQCFASVLPVFSVCSFDKTSALEEEQRST